MNVIFIRFSLADVDHRERERAPVVAVTLRRRDENFDIVKSFFFGTPTSGYPTLKFLTLFAFCEDGLGFICPSELMM